MNPNSKKKRLLATGLAGLLALLVVGVALAAPFTIDTFDEALQSLFVFSGFTVDSSTATGAGVLGTERDALLEWQNGGDRAFLDIDFNDSDLLAFSQGPGLSSIATVTWDGTDGDATALDPTGLGGVDLTNGGPNDGIRLRVTIADLDTSLNLAVYTDGNNWSEYDMEVPGGILSGNSVDFFAPFASFTTGGTGPADFTNVGALVLTMDGTVSPGTDLTLEFMETDGVRDFGDVPPSYTAGTLAASHIPGGLRLGSNVDVEEQANSSTNADGDNNDQSPDDEDGVSPTPGHHWNDVDNGSVDVVVNGCDGTCYLAGWVDWDNDGDFSTPGDRVINNAPVSNGTTTVGVPIDPGTDTTNVSLYARFRICPVSGACSSAETVDVMNGEVEDYLWDFGPTAVTLTGLEARPVQGSAALVLLGGGLLLAMGLLIATRRGLFRRST